MAAQNEAASAAPAPEPNLPPVGRSLFDFLFAKGVPFPFPELLASIEAQLADAGGVQKTLVPLGRSLQRGGGGPDYFRFPRAVVAVDGEAALRPRESGMHLEDRLFIGYQAKLNQLEVISYNEEAGRFEFQLVHDYGKGQRPTVFYGERRVCSPCHQHGLPLFARAPWDETAANRRVRELLLNEREEFFGISPSHGVDVPAAFDAATDRAGMLGVWQAVWRRGCSTSRCRADGLLAALQFRLSGDRHTDGAEQGYKESFGRALAAGWRDAWPDGLVIPDVDIPNRDPIGGERPTRGQGLRREEFGTARPRNLAELSVLAEVDPLFEPSRVRAPREVWRHPDRPRVDAMVAGLGSFFALPDIRRLDAHLYDRGLREATPHTAMSARCVLRRRPKRESNARRYGAACGGADEALALTATLSVEGGSVTGGRLRSIRLGGLGRLSNLRLEGAGGGEERLRLLERGSGLHARLPGGDAIRDVVFRLGDDAGGSSEPFAQVTVIVQHDFAMVAEVVDEMQRRADDALSAKPLRRARALARLFDGLAIEGIDWCCVETTGLPPARLVSP